MAQPRCYGCKGNLYRLDHITFVTEVEVRYSHALSFYQFTVRMITSHSFSVDADTEADCVLLRAQLLGKLGWDECSC